MRILRRLVTDETITLVLSPTGGRGRHAKLFEALGPAKNLVPRAIAAFADGSLSLNPLEPEGPWLLTFDSRETEEALLPALLETRFTADDFTPTQVLESLGHLALACWWDRWCPAPVPEGLLQADIGVWSWRAGLTRAAFDHLDGDGAASLAQWLRRISNEVSPEPLATMLTEAATDASAAIGPARAATSGLERQLSIWNGTTSIPDSPEEMQDLWTQWDGAQRWNPAPDTALAMGAPIGAFVGLAGGHMSAGLAVTRSARGPRRSILPPASVDWHAVMPRVLAGGEDTVRAVVDWQKKSVRIQVEALAQPRDVKVKGLVAQLADSRSGRLVGEVIPLVARAGAMSFEARGPLPREVTLATVDRFEPYVRLAGYEGPVRTGAEASAARAQRYTVRAIVAARTIEAMEWLDLPVPPRLQRDSVAWIAQAQLALQDVEEDLSAGPPEASDSGSLSPADAHYSEDASVTSYKVPTLAALFLAIAEQP